MVMMCAVVFVFPGLQPRLKSGSWNRSETSLMMDKSECVGCGRIHVCRCEEGTCVGVRRVHVCGYEEDTCVWGVRRVHVCGCEEGTGV